MFHSHIHVLKCDYGFLNAFVDMGAVAMTGFYLLSGYDLDFSSRKKNMTDIREIKRFYVKRLIAILPLYYVYALLNVLINITMGGQKAIWQELMLFPVETLGIQSTYSSLTAYSHNGGSWFISCILICYLLYPFLYVLTSALNNGRKMFLSFLLMCVLLWSPLVVGYFRLETIYSNPFFRVLEFAIGMLVAQLNVSDAKTRFILFLRKPIICLLSLLYLIGGVSIAYHIGIPHDYMLYSWVALPCFISLLFSLGHIKFERLQCSKCIHYLSSLAFSIFLSQLIIVWRSVKLLFDTIGIDSNIGKILLSGLICFGIANFLHYCVEKTSARYLKEKFL